MRIKTDKVLTFDPKESNFSYTIRPEMGVVRHFPRKVCEALIKMGATEVPPDRDDRKAAKAAPKSA